MINRVEEFKARLNKAMSLRGMRAIDIKEKTGLSESTISQYRSGYAKPRSDKLQLLADALDVSPAWLMGLDVPMDRIEHKAEVDFETTWIKSGGGEHPVPLDDTEKKLIEMYRNADNDTRRMIDRLLEYTKQSYSDAPMHYVGRAARRHTNPTRLTKKRKDKV